MQISVTCPDLGLPAVSVTASVDSIVSDVLTAAAEEWDIDLEEVELSFAGDILCETERLADHGVDTNSELEMWKKRFRLFGKCWFVDDSMRERLLRWLRSNSGKLYLDTPTFSEDGCLTFTDLLPLDAKLLQISFRNSNSDITVISQGFLRKCSQITALDLSELSSVTTIGGNFLSSSSITSLNLSGLKSVTTVEDFFLSSCTRITTLDLSGLSSVTTIGFYFLTSCSQIITIDLSCLHNVVAIKDYFLYECSRITWVTKLG